MLFAHFAADYPFQSNWMVRNKTRTSILVLHVFIHFLVYSVIVLTISWELLSATWYYLLLLALLHFGIDTVKNQVSRMKPEWIAGSYLVDQFAHFVTIYLVAGLVQSRADQMLITIVPAWPVYAAAYLIVTYVWFVSERIFAEGNARQRQEVIAYSWPRMIARAVFLSLMMLAWRGFGGAEVQAGVIWQFFASSVLAYFSLKRITWLNTRTVTSDIAAVLVGLAYIIIGTG